MISERTRSPYKYIFNNPVLLLKPRSNNQVYQELIKQRMINSTNPIEIKMLSELAINMGEFRKELFKTFIDARNEYSLFESYQLLPTSHSWSGSAVPHINQEILFLEDILLLIPKGLKYISHRKRVYDLIEYKKNDRNRWEEREILEDF